MIKLKKLQELLNRYDLEKIIKVGKQQAAKYNMTGRTDGMYYFEFEGQIIIDPTTDPTARYRVDPEKYYGKKNLAKFFKKKV